MSSLRSGPIGGMNLDVRRDRPYPLYLQLAEVILSEIKSGRLKPGDRLPGERELAEQAGMSRMTVRQAMACLVRQDAIVVQHGLGTFVADPKLTYDALHLMSFTEQLLEQGLEPSSRILEQTVVQPSPDVAAALQVGEHADTVKLVRLRLSADVPLVLESIHIPSELCPGLVDEDLSNRSLYSLLEERYGLELTRATQDLAAVVSNEYESELFGVPLGTGLMLLEGVTYSASGRPVERFKAVYRGDRFEFRVHSERPASVASGRAEPSVSVVLNGS